MQDRQSEGAFVDKGENRTTPILVVYVYTRAYICLRKSTAGQKGERVHERNALNYRITN